ncbi:MAG: beta-ketoacyl-ACP synthase II [Enterococcus sp.]
MNEKRVVVTGMGSISAQGNNPDELWEQIKNGQSGISKITLPGFEEIGSQIGGWMPNFEAKEFLDRKDIKQTDRATQFGLIASEQALAQAQFKAEDFDLDKCGTVIGTGIGGMSSLLENNEKLVEKGPRRVSPLTVPKMIVNMVAGFVSIKTGFRGMTMTPVSACATGNQAIGEAFLAVKSGRCQAALAGGTEASILPLAYAGFDNMHAMSTRNDAPQKASRPFDQERDGFVMSEGAGVLFLEEREHALDRGAHILGEIVGYGMTSDAYHMTSPSSEGAVRAMQEALSMAEVKPEEIIAINAHATSTGVGDISEIKALKTVFGEHAQNLKISATKSMTGHLLGAAGGIEAVIALKSLETGILPPTINMENPDEAFDLDCVANQAIDYATDYVLSNGFGFGGHNSTVLFKK